MGVSASVQLFRAARAGDVVKMHDAVAKGADVDVVQKRRSALSIAAERGHYDAVNYLLNSNAQDIRTCKGDTALHVACRNGRERVTELLIHRGANHWAVNNKGHTPYEVAMRKNKVLIVRLVETLTFPFVGWFEMRRGTLWHSWSRVWVGLVRPRPGDDPTVDRGICQLLIFKSQVVARPKESLDLREAVIRVVSGELPALEGVPLADARPRRPASREEAPVGGYHAAAVPVEPRGAEEPPMPAERGPAEVAAEHQVVVFTVTRANGRRLTFRCPAATFRAFYSVVTGAFAKGAGAAFEVDDYSDRRRVSREEMDSVARASDDAEEPVHAVHAPAVAGWGGPASAVDPALALPMGHGVPVVAGVAVPDRLAPAGWADEEADGGARGDVGVLHAVPVALPAAGLAPHVPAPAAARASGARASAHERKEGGEASRRALSSPAHHALEPLNTAGVPASSLDAAPEHMLCPITTELMLDPVCAADGHTYERAAITAWLAEHATSPATGEALPGGDRSLRVNHSMRSQVSLWLDEQRAASALLAATGHRGMSAAAEPSVSSIVGPAGIVRVPPHTPVAPAGPPEPVVAAAAPAPAASPARAVVAAPAAPRGGAGGGDDAAPEVVPRRLSPVPQPAAAAPASPSHAMAAAVVAPALSPRRDAAPAAADGKAEAAADADRDADGDVDEGWDEDLEALQHQTLRAPWGDMLPAAPPAPSGSVAAAVAAIEEGAGAAAAAAGAAAYPSLSASSLPPLVAGGAHVRAAEGDEFAELLASLPAVPSDDVVVHDMAVPRLARSMETQWNARARAQVAV